jgi:phosphate starvation-inducible protein PhoH
MAKSKNNTQLQPDQPQITLANNRLRLRLDDMKVIEPLTDNQKLFFDAYEDSSIMLLHGVAGTGKTFIALYHALEEVLDKANPFKRVIVVRSAVPSREIGHLPGDEKEKTEVYTEPYVEVCQDLFGRHDAYQRLEEQGAIKFLITSFVRGITLEDSIIIVDECQNMTDMELNSVITRVGNRSKIVFCGDFRQTDLYRKTDMSGLKKFMAIADMMPSFKTFEFGVDDIVRSAIVKEYILARLDYETRYCT